MNSYAVGVFHFFLKFRRKFFETDCITISYKDDFKMDYFLVTHGFYEGHISSLNCWCGQIGKLN